MRKKFDINQTKIKGGYQSRRKVVPYDSKSDLPLAVLINVNNNKNKMNLFHDLESGLISILRNYKIFQERILFMSSVWA